MPPLSCPRSALRRLLIAIGALVSLMAASTTVAHAASAPGDVYFTQTSYTAREDQGELPITIARTDTSSAEQVRYGVRHLDAQEGMDLETVHNTLVNFAPGQSTYTFNVKIIDRGMSAGPVLADAYLFGSYPQSLGDATGKFHAHGPVNSPITILRDDPLETRNPLDLLGFDATSATSTTPTAPLDAMGESPFYIAGKLSPSGSVAWRYRKTHPAWHHQLKFLADEPGATASSSGTPRPFRPTPLRDTSRPSRPSTPTPSSS